MRINTTTILNTVIGGLLTVVALRMWDSYRSGG